MKRISRRQLLKNGAVAGVAGAVTLGTSWNAKAQDNEPRTDRFVTKDLLQRHEEHQVSLTSGDLVVSFDLRYGTVSSIARKSDPYALNYISNAKNTPEVDGNYVFRTGDLALTTWELLRNWQDDDPGVGGQFRSSGNWRSESTSTSPDIRRVTHDSQSFRVSYVGRSTAADGIRDLNVKMTYHFDADGALLWDINLSNTTGNVLEVGELGIPLRLNDDYAEFVGMDPEEIDPHSEQKNPEEAYRARTIVQQSMIHEQKVLVHHFIGGHSSYSLVLRPLGDSPFLLIHPTQDTAFECVYKELSGTGLGEGGERWAGPDILAIHSRATKSLRGWQHNSWVNGHTSLLLGPGEQKSYQMRFVFIPSYEAIRDEVAKAGNLGIRIVPSMVVQEDRDVHVELKSRGEIDRIELLSDGITIRSRRKIAMATLLKCSFKGRGLKTLKCRYGNGRWTNLHFNCVESYESLLKARSKFIVDREYYQNPEDPFHRNHMFLPFDYRKKCIILESEEAWEVGGSDEPGFSASLFLAEKNVYYPSEREIAALENYVSECLFKYIQDPKTYTVRASLFWLKRLPSSPWSEWSKARSEATWRTYNYVHPANIYYALYKIGTRYGLLTHRTAEEYLRMSYQTCMKWFQTGPWRDVGLMEGSNAIYILEDIKKKGWKLEYDTLREAMSKCSTAFSEQPYPYGSELLVDQTAHEQVYFFTRYFDDRPKNAKTVQVLKALRGGNQPIWFNYGNDKRRDITCWYSASLNGLALLKSFEDSGDQDALAKGYGGVTSVMANVTYDGMGFNYYDCRAGVLDHQPPITWEGGCGLWGFLQATKAYVVKDPAFGLIGYGCEVMSTSEKVTVIPYDGLRKRVFFAEQKIEVEALAGEINEVSLSRADRISLAMTDSTGLAKQAILRVHGLADGKYHITSGDESHDAESQAKVLEFRTSMGRNIEVSKA
jgi:hypothetical protein